MKTVNDTETRDKQQLITTILRKARVSQVIKPSGYSKPQVKAIIAGLLGKIEQQEKTISQLQKNVDANEQTQRLMWNEIEAMNARYNKRPWA